MNKLPKVGLEGALSLYALVDVRMNTVRDSFIQQPEALSPYFRKEKQRGAQPWSTPAVPTSHHVARQASELAQRSSCYEALATPYSIRSTGGNLFCKKTTSRNRFIKYNLKLIIFVFELSQVDELIERALHRLQNLQCYHLSASEFTWKLIQQGFKAITCWDLKNHKSNIYINQRKM